MTLPVKVSQLDGRNGPVKNQFILTTADGGKTQLDEKYWNYSTTTGKYRNRFLNEDRKATERKIKNGDYILTNLNA